MTDDKAIGDQTFGERLRLFAKRLGECGHLMVGLPDYETYVAHIARAHPGQTPMTYKQFFRDRQAARFGDGGTRGMRCC
jgi:uncharacterized short protein YbdD (DUF466 family)